MNPLEFFVQAYWYGMSNSYLLNVIFKLMFLFMLFVCVFKRNLIGGAWYQTDRDWSNLCGTLINRLEKLLPVYEQHMLGYAKLIQQDIRHQPMLSLARSIPKDVKLRAEQDLVFRDFGNDRVLLTLHMQLASLMKHLP